MSDILDEINKEYDAQARKIDRQIAKAAQNKNFITEKNNPFPSFFRERVFLHETNGEAGRKAN